MLILPSNTTSQNLYTHDHLITKFYKHGNRKGPMPNILICELMSFKELGQKKKRKYTPGIRLPIFKLCLHCLLAV